MGKFIYKKEKWETKDGYITTYGYEDGESLSIKESIKLGLFELPKEAMQKIFSDNELEELGYADFKKNK